MKRYMCECDGGHSVQVIENAGVKYNIRDKALGVLKQWFVFGDVDKYGVPDSLHIHNSGYRLYNRDGYTIFEHDIEASERPVSTTVVMYEKANEQFLKDRPLALCVIYKRKGDEVTIEIKGTKNPLPMRKFRANRWGMPLHNWLLRNGWKFVMSSGDVTK